MEGTIIIPVTYEKKNSYQLIIECLLQFLQQKWPFISFIGIITDVGQKLQLSKFDWKQNVGKVGF